MNQGREVRVKRIKEKDNKRERENKKRFFSWENYLLGVDGPPN